MAGKIVGQAMHDDHGYYPVYQTRKGNYYWRCLDCGTVKFFADLNKLNCTHSRRMKPTKNGKYLYLSCPICRTREFKPVQVPIT
jgi:predicted nucleic-acid-binding Zn-ribbon protein